MVGSMGVPRVIIAGQTISDTTLSPANASATLFIFNDGSYKGITVTDGDIPYGSWVKPEGAAALFELKATELIGTVSAGTVGSWVSPSAFWTVDKASLGTKECSLQIEMRFIGSTNIVSDETFLLSATKDT